MLEATAVGERLVPTSYGAYARLIRAAEQALGLSVGWTPHSARAGFASDGIARGRPAPDIQEEGRWRSAESFRTYVDVITAASINASLEAKGLGPA